MRVPLELGVIKFYIVHVLYVTQYLLYFLTFHHVQFLSIFARIVDQNLIRCTYLCLI